MGSIGSILDAKELASSFQPLLLCEFQFPNGTYFRVSTHPLSDGGYNTTPTSGSYQYGGHAWIPRVLNQDVGATQSMSDFGFDVPPQVQVVLADPDREVYGLEVANGFKGSVLKLYAIMWDSGNSLTGSFSTDVPMIKFIGTCSAATQIDQKTTTVVATSLLNMTQQSMPPVRIQPLCPGPFLQLQRLERMGKPTTTVSILSVATLQIFLAASETTSLALRASRSATRARLRAWRGSATALSRFQFCRTPPLAPLEDLAASTTCQCRTWGLPGRTFRVSGR